MEFENAQGVPTCSSQISSLLLHCVFLFPITGLELKLKHPLTTENISTSEQSINNVSDEFIARRREERTRTNQKAMSLRSSKHSGKKKKKKKLI